MFFPLGTDRALHRWSMVTWSIVALNILIFAALAAYERNAPDAAAALTGRFVLAGDSPVWYTFFTHQFLHADFFHIAGNMLFLWVFGPNVEDRFGRLGFLGFYLASGCGAALAHVIFEHAGALGASGAIAGVTGAYIVLFPRTNVKIFYWYFIFGVRWIPAWIIIGLAIAKDVIFTGIGWSGNVATIAHIGGYVSGFATAMILMATNVLPSEGLDLFFTLKQAKRRQDFRDAMAAKPTNKPLPPGLSDALAEARAKVSTAAAQGDATAAAAAYADLLKLVAGPGPRATLAVRPQQELAMLLMTSGQRPLAANAFESFLLTYPKDSEATGIRLLLALLCLNDLDQPARAKATLDAITSEPPDAQQRELLAHLRERLAAQPSV